MRKFERFLNWLSQHRTFTIMVFSPLLGGLWAFLLLGMMKFNAWFWLS